MEDANNSIEPMDTGVDAADDILEVENNSNEETTSADVDAMDESEFADFEEKSFEDESPADDADEAEEPVELTDEDLEAKYKAQMSDVDAKINKPITIKVNGKIYDVDSVAELKNLAELGVNSTQRFQAIAQHRKTLDYMEDNDIRQEDLDLLVQSRGEAPIVRDASVNATEDVAQSILDSDIADEFTRLASELPDDVKQMMSTNPNMMSGFAHDVRTGLAGAIAPVVSRYMNVNGMTHMQAYGRARSEFASKNQQQEQPQQQKQQPQNTIANKRDTLQSQPKPGASVSKGGMSEADMDKMSDAEFEKYWDSEDLWK